MTGASDTAAGTSGTPGDGPGDGWVLGVDSGGSGVRLALADRGDGPGATLRREVPVPISTSGAGIDAAGLLAVVLPAARELLAAAGARTVSAVAVGAAGMATLGDDLRTRLPGAFTEAFGARWVVLAADAVTAYAGALGDHPGAVVAAGTGLIALGTDLSGWRRVDGWGHLLGDCGGGAWIGRAGLEAALRAHDGRRGGSTALLEAARAQFGDPQDLPGQLYPRADRPAVLASFAPRVADRARDGDPVASAIIQRAGGHIADAAAAACPADRPCLVAHTGGLFGMGELLLGPVRTHLAEARPLARLVPAGNAPLHGALRLAAGVAEGTLRLPVEPPLLRVIDRCDPAARG
ncbi:ATPase [Wenjunlia vitaminophila]|uniref:ATPase n=1 Tax=Wenjunlia vitaminophila TaxID=76728 RepID=A0A0T6LQV1_WENVI|nr:BadF/BadG/BcrA/BcrD ATPase family protein [Wenjunlia vitaminophila]KRV48258.1 ATPase [Wenjunlia vitaminophila]